MTRLFFEFTHGVFDVPFAKSAAFTGKRPHTMGYSEGSAQYEQMLVNLRTAVSDCFRDGVRVFYSGMADGFDLLAVQAVLDLRESEPCVMAIGVIPFTCHYDRWDQARREHCKQLLCKMDGYVVLEPSFTQGCLQRRNRYLVDSADVLIACPGAGTPSGGTAQTIAMAVKQQKPVIFV